MATRRKADNQKVTKPKPKENISIDCRMINLVLVESHSKRNKDIPQDIEPSVPIQSIINAINIVTPSAQTKNEFDTEVRLQIELKSAEAEKLLTLDMVFSALFASDEKNDQQVITYLRRHAAEYVFPHVSQFVADLVARSGLPSLYLQLNEMIRNEVPSSSTQPKQHPTIQ